MTAQQLKNAILQMAVQGKLVPQDPNDEPASVLLERIRAEKEALIKAGKIRKEKNPSVIFRGPDNLPYEKTGRETRCIADEIPFEIPACWGFVRLGSIVVNYDSKRRPVTKNERKTEHGYYDYYGATGAIDRVDDYLFDGEYLMIGEDGGNFFTERDNSFVATGKFWVNNHVHVVQPIVLNIYFLKRFLDSCNFAKMGLINGIAVPKLNQANLNSIIVPLPPLAEQVRIVAKIEELMPHLEEFDQAEARVEKLNAEFPEQLKKSILQWAIQGKLVPQAPSDEPASVLLDRIRAEKAKLVKTGKIKKDKTESVIFKRDNSHYEKLNGIERCIDDEIPFEIPDSWRWARLGTLITLLSGQDFPPSAYNSHNIGTPYITGASNIENGVISINRWTDSPRNIALRGDLLIVCKGAGVGKMAILDLENVHIARQIMAIRSYNLVSNEYVMLFLTAQVNKIRAQMNGLIPGIDRHVMLNFLTPLPPLAEQQRIVKALEALFCKLGV